MDNLPSICVGVGETHDGPPEPWFKEFPHRTLAGHPQLASHIVEQALEHDFEPAVSHHLALDHGFCIPVWKAGLDPLPPIVPIVFNDLEPPFPAVRRCYAWGTMLADAIARFPGKLRVAVLATGGLSHSIGEPTMGEIDEAFDRECIRRFEAGDPPALFDFLNGAYPPPATAPPRCATGSPPTARRVEAEDGGIDLIRCEPDPRRFMLASRASPRLVRQLQATAERA